MDRAGTGQEQATGDYECGKELSGSKNMQGIS